MDSVTPCPPQNALLPSSISSAPLDELELELLELELLELDDELLELEELLDELELDELLLSVSEPAPQPMSSCVANRPVKNSAFDLMGRPFVVSDYYWQWLLVMPRAFCSKTIA